MPPTEPFATALLLAVIGVLMAASTLASRAAGRAGVPIVLIFLLLGMLAGAGGAGAIAFQNYHLAFRLGTAALALILFDGGLNTPATALRLGGGPAALLATIGVIGTAALVGVAAHALGFGWSEALLLGVVVSSTDAAAVFAVLRASGLQLKRRVGTTLELESGINDPVAVILTIVLTRNLLQPGELVGWRIVLEVASQIAIGGGVGAAIGYVGRQLLRRIRLPAGGLYPVLTLSIALLSFGLPTLVHGSGFLAVYIAGLVLGNAALPYRNGLLRVHDALAWLSQVAMFLVLGLLVSPSRLAGVANSGLALALFLAVFARPLVAALCLIPFRFPLREIVYVGWVGLRGAVPIVLATYPVLMGAEAAHRIFDLVFFIVVANAIIPGATVRPVTRWLGLETPEHPQPKALLEINSLETTLKGELMSFYIDPALAVTDVSIGELPFPEGAAATLIVRGNELIAPKGHTVIQPGDHIYVICGPEDVPFVQLMFGRPEV